MKFLIVKTSSLGDVIHSFPIPSYLKSHFPTCQIDWVIEAPFAELVKAHPLVNQTICINMKKWRKNIFSKETFREISSFRQQLRKDEYDAVFDLQGNTKSAFVTCQARSKNKIGFASQSVPEWPNLLVTNQRYNPPKGQNIREDYLCLVQKYFNDVSPFQDPGVSLNAGISEKAKIETILGSKELNNRTKILVCAGSIWRNKQLTTEGLAAFLEKINTVEPVSFLFAWGSQQEKEIAYQLQAKFPTGSIVIDRLPLSALQNLMGQVNLVIAMDSLPLHLAGTTATPTFSIFGASSAQKYKPQGHQHGVFQGSCPYGRTFEKRCPILRTCESGACIRGLDSGVIFEEFLLWRKGTTRNDGRDAHPTFNG